MLNPVVGTFTFLRAKWRWTHGRCRLCNRNLYARLPPCTAAPPDCPACKGVTAADMRMGVWGGLADFRVEGELLSGLAPEPAGTNR